PAADQAVDWLDSTEWSDQPLSGQPPPGSRVYRHACLDHLLSLVVAPYQRRHRTRRAFGRPSVPGMDLLDALRTTGAIREFTPEPVPDDVVARILDTARFAPSGGNRQAWHVVVVKDAGTRRRLRDLYLEGWYPYLAMTAAGLTPWSPLNDREAEARAVAGAPGIAEAAPAGFAERL